MIELIEKNRYLAVILAVLIAIEIFYVSSIPGSQAIAPEIIFDITILYHFMVFFLLAFFVLTSIKGKGKIKTSHIIITIILSILYAVLDEVHQMFVPFRAADIFDILVDMAGIFLAMLLYVFIDKNKI